MGRKEFLDSLKVNKSSNRYTSKKLDFDKLQKNVRKLLVVGALSVSVLGFTGCGTKNADKKPEIPIHTEEQSVDTYEHLDSIDGVLKDFKERYIKEYNEANGTNIRAEDITINRASTNYLYKINGKYVTHGSKPYETEKILKEVGNYEDVSGDIKIYQIIDENSGKALESYAKGGLDNREYLQASVISGNNLNSLKNELSKNHNSILSKYIEGIDIISNIKSSDKFNNDTYIEFIEKLDNKEIEYQR